MYNALSGVVATIFFLCFNGFSAISSYSLWLGIVFGMLTVMQVVGMMIAFQTGPMSFTVVIVNFSTVITALSGVMFWDEKIKLLQIFGVVLSLISFVFAVEKKAAEKQASFKWLIFCLLAMLSTGSIGLLQKVHQTSIYKGEADGFLLVSFICLTITSFACMEVLKRKEKVTLLPQEAKTQTWLLIIIMLITGVFIAVPNKLNLYLSGIIDAVIFFPLVNGGNLLLSTLVAFVAFKEKLSKKQWVGLLLGISSFACLCI